MKQIYLFALLVLLGFTSCRENNFQGEDFPESNTKNSQKINQKTVDTLSQTTSTPVTNSSNFQEDEDPKKPPIK